MKFTLQCETREDGGLRVYSDDIPGLILSHSDPRLVMADVWPAVLQLQKCRLHHKEPKMTKFRREIEGENGWSDWIHPLGGYKISCCDCGLVHDLEFRIDDENKLNFRARRNARSTGQVRRHMTHEERSDV